MWKRGPLLFIILADTFTMNDQHNIKSIKVATAVFNLAFVSIHPPFLLNYYNNNPFKHSLLRSGRPFPSPSICCCVDTSNYPLAELEWVQLRGLIIMCRDNAIPVQ